MKIYAYGVPDKDIPTPFDQYIGQDIWVKCEYTYRHDAFQFYARFVSKKVLNFGDGRDLVSLSFNRLLPKEVHALRHGNVSDEQIRKLITSTESVYADNIKLVQPVDTITSKYILKHMDTYELTESILDKYIGKDVWIKARFTVQHSIYRTVYLKVLSKQDYYVTFQYIDSGYIDEQWGFDPDEDVYSMMHPWRPSRCHIDDIIISTPVEAYTSEEIEEMLSLCPEYIDDEVELEWADDEEEE